MDPLFNGDNISKQANNNYPELDVPAINEKMKAAKLLTDPKERAAAWGEIDRLITEQAPAVPWLWDKWPNIRSANVNGVVNLWNNVLGSDVHVDQVRHAYSAAPRSRGRLVTCSAPESHLFNSHGPATASGSRAPRRSR